MLSERAAVLEDTPAAAWPDELFRPGVDQAHLESRDGRRFQLFCDRWHRPPERADELVLARCRGPVLDVGCGPGRHLEALRERGTAALGIDTSPVAVLLARRRGLPVLQHSVFAALPGAGSWATVLLLDGNIGIGGDVPALLRRVAQLLRPGGRAIIETASPLVLPGSTTVRVRHGASTGAWFRWAVTTPADLERRAATARLSTDQVLRLEERWFALLRRDPGPLPGRSERSVRPR